MKKKFFFLATILISQFSFGQIPNNYFEEWEIINGIETPVGWQVTSDTVYYLSEEIKRVATFEKFEMANEGNFSLKLYKNYNSSDPAEVLAETTFMPDEIFQELSASIRMDSVWHVDYGKVYVKILERTNGNFEEIGYWEKITTTNDIEHIYINLNQTQIDSIKIQIAARVNHPVNVYYGYSELIIDELELSTSTGIHQNDSELNAIQIFPNPTFSQIFISLKNQSIPSKVECYDYSGQLIFTKNQSSTINLSNCSNGIYLLKVFDSENNFTTHLINKLD